MAQQAIFNNILTKKMWTEIKANEAVKSCLDRAGEQTEDRESMVTLARMFTKNALGTAALNLNVDALAGADKTAASQITKNMAYYPGNDHMDPAAIKNVAIRVTAHESALLEAFLKKGTGAGKITTDSDYVRRVKKVSLFVEKCMMPWSDRERFIALSTGGSKRDVTNAMPAFEMHHPAFYVIAANAAQEFNRTVREIVGEADEMEIKVVTLASALSGAVPAGPRNGSQVSPNLVETEVIHMADEDGADEKKQFSPASADAYDEEAAAAAALLPVADPVAEARAQAAIDASEHAADAARVAFIQDSISMAEHNAPSAPELKDEKLSSADIPFAEGVVRFMDRMGKGTKNWTGREEYLAWKKEQSKAPKLARKRRSQLSDLLASADALEFTGKHSRDAVKESSTETARRKRTKREAEAK